MQRWCPPVEPAGRGARHEFHMTVVTGARLDGRVASAAGQRTVAIAHGPWLREARVGLVHVARLTLHADAVPTRRLVHAIAAPKGVPSVLARADGEHHTRSRAGADDDVVRVR